MTVRRPRKPFVWHFDVIFMSRHEETGLISQALRRSVDLVITDMMMPVMDGAELASEMRMSETHRGIPTRFPRQ